MLLQRLTRHLTPVVLALLAQDPQPAPQQPVFRASASLGVVDAVVTDGNGRHVTDLTIEDFELVVAGRRRQLRHAMYVPLGEVARQRELPTPQPRATASPLRPTAREDMRIIGVVVDDLGLSFESTYAVRTALKKFVDGQVQPGDLVAILRLGGGVGALQQFTTDRRLMLAAADRVQWSVVSRSGISAFSPMATSDWLGDQTMSGSGTAEQDSEDTLAGARTSMLARASLDALEYVVRGIEHLPGRKAIVFFSEGLRLLPNARDMQSAASRRVWNAFTRLMDRANRAGVVVYTIDPRGLVTGRALAEDDPQGRPPPARGVAAIPPPDAPSGDLRRAFLTDSQEALTFIARQTGGFAVLNNNDMSVALGRVLNDLTGYYLLGYETGDDEVGPWDAGRFQVRVKRAGLRVRSRRGLFGPAAVTRQPEPPQGDRLALAALSPFAASDIPLRLTALFAYDTAAGPFVRSLLFIDPNSVGFTPDGTGRHAASLELLQIVTGDNGEAIGDWRRTISFSLTDDQVREARARGIVYSTRMPVKKPGAYQVRIAVQDRTSMTLGSASQFIEVPEVGSGRLALSGVVMRATTRGGVPVATLAAASEDGIGLASEALGEPAVRIFERNTNVIYAYEVYDGVRRKLTDRLVVRTALLRDGRVVLQNDPSPLAPRSHKEKVRVVPMAGQLSLTSGVPRGTYTFQVSIAAPGRTRGRAASQWMDFEVR